MMKSVVFCLPPTQYHQSLTPSESLIINDARLRILRAYGRRWIIARGNTLEEAFSNAAKAVFEVMTDTSKVRRESVKKLQFSATIWRTFFING
jgi:archease family protein